MSKSFWVSLTLLDISRLYLCQSSIAGFASFIFMFFSSSFHWVSRFDEPGWGTFDNNDDVDSVWGFNAKVSRQILTHI